MKTTLCVIIWVVYCAVSLLYFASYGLIEPIYSKILYLSASLVVILFTIITLLKKPSGYCLAFLALCLSAIALNFMFILIYHLFNIDNYIFKFCTFIGVEFITALFILISGNKRGLFQNE